MQPDIFLSYARASGLDVATLHEQFGCAYSSVAIRIAEVVRDPPLLVVLYEREEQGHPAMNLNAEGIPSSGGKRWAQDHHPCHAHQQSLHRHPALGRPVQGQGRTGRVENAFPAIVTPQEFSRVNRLLVARAPKQVHPRRAASPYLLSGIAKCESCGKALTASEAKGSRYTHYVCQSLLKKGKDACNTPRLNAKSFEDIIISNIRDNILTESNIRDLVKLVDEEMNGVAREQRQNLETIEAELEEVKRKLDRVWHFAESTDLDMADASERILEHRHRREQLEAAAEEAQAVLSERRQFLDSADTVAAFAQDMGGVPRYQRTHRDQGLLQGDSGQARQRPSSIQSLRRRTRR